jgi:hypothetical protein
LILVHHGLVVRRAVRKQQHIIRSAYNM